MKIAILGFGREGKSVLKFIKRHGGPATKNSEVWILDKNKTLKVPAGLKKHLGAVYLENLEKFGVVYRSPGIPYNSAALKKAGQRGVIFSSATKIFFNRCPGKIIGITGTKGKGTTATLLYKILKTAHEPAFLAGNIGKSPLELLLKLNKKSLIILELSSFQLQDLTKSPAVAVILDIFPDHQDAHLSLKEYYQAKTNITRYQKVGDKVFYFKNSTLSRWAATKSRGRRFPVNEKKFGLFKPGELKIKGLHNFKNAVMAAVVAKNLGIPLKTIRKTAINFRGMEHRLEFVRWLKGVEFYNDSSSTNPQTAAAAVRAFPNQPKILIAGGFDKGLGYKPLASALKNSGTKSIILFGQNRKKIARTIKKQGIGNKRQETVFAKNLKEAVKLAYKKAKFYILNSISCVILFSPGAASFDMFKNYADRGRQFKKIVKKLK